MRTPLLIAALALALSACEPVGPVTVFSEPVSGDPDAGAPLQTVASTLEPVDGEEGEVVDVGALTSEGVEIAGLDGETEAPAAPTGTLLGRSLASIGDATQPGLWAETALVSTVQMGQLLDPISGTTATVELRPGAGALRVSLSALEALGVPFTELRELEVYSGS